MAAVDTVSTLLDLLDDMVTILRLYELGDTFRVFQVERNVRELRQQLCLAHET